jgi:hypothetical protein
MLAILRLDATLLNPGKSKRLRSSGGDATLVSDLQSRRPSADGRYVALDCQGGEKIRPEVGSAG